MACNPLDQSTRVANKAAAKLDATRSTGRPSRVVNELPTSRLVDQRIRDLAGWRGENPARIWALILEADPEMIGVENDEWARLAVWSNTEPPGNDISRVVGRLVPSPVLLANR